MEQQAKERLERLSALRRIKPVDMTKLSQQVSNTKTSKVHSITYITLTKLDITDKLFNKICSQITFLVLFGLQIELVDVDDRPRQLFP